MFACFVFSKGDVFFSRAGGDFHVFICIRVCRILELTYMGSYGRRYADIVAQRQAYNFVARSYDARALHGTGPLDIFPPHHFWAGVAVSMSDYIYPGFTLVPPDGPSEGVVSRHPCGFNLPA
jgi:hypothetical protein